MNITLELYNVVKMADEKNIQSNDPYLAVLREVVSTKMERGSLYVKEPKDVAPIEALEGILLYKAHRAVQYGC